jgi:hypothetical protein
MVDVDGRVRMVAVRQVAVRIVTVGVTGGTVAVDEELALAAAHAVRGAGGTFGVGVGGSGGGSLHEQGFAELSHCAAQLKKEQRTLALAFRHPPLNYATKKVSRFPSAQIPR